MDVLAGWLFCFCFSFWMFEGVVYKDMRLVLEWP